MAGWLFTGITLEGDMSDVIALDQPTSHFFTSESDKKDAQIFRKVRYLSFPIYTCVISLSLTSGEVQHPICLVYIKNRYVVEDPSSRAADVFPRKLRWIRYAHALSDNYSTHSAY